MSQCETVSPSVSTRSRPAPVLGLAERGGHVVWFDYAKGLCILLVVMMHSTLGVGEVYAALGLAGEGFLHWVVAFAKPFRMPDFFVLSGLFLGLAIGRGWLHYLDKKLVHFAYFYVLWLLLQLPLRLMAGGDLSVGGLASQLWQGLVSPFPTLWFIYVLPVMFILTKALAGLPSWALFAGAVALKLSPIHTGFVLVDHYLADHYVYFLAGYIFAPVFFSIARWSAGNAVLAGMVLFSWAFLNGATVFTASPFEGWNAVADLPGIGLALGAMGAVAIVMAASLLARFDALRFVRYCGAHSLAIYVSFTIPMALTRTVLAKSGVVTDTGLASTIVWAAAVTGPLVVFALVRATRLRFLYERPAWFRLPYEGRSSAAMRGTGRVAAA